MVCAATPGTALVGPAVARPRAVPGVAAQTTTAQTVSWSIPITTCLCAAFFNKLLQASVEHFKLSRKCKNYCWNGKSIAWLHRPSTTKKVIFPVFGGSSSKTVNIFVAKTARDYKLQHLSFLFKSEIIYSDYLQFACLVHLFRHIIFHMLTNRYIARLFNAGIDNKQKFNMITTLNNKNACDIRSCCALIK